MSWIINNQKTLNNVAIIALKHKKGNIKTQQKGDFIAILVDNEIVGINVLNANKYFNFSPKIKTLDQKIINLLKDKFPKLEVMPFFKIGEILTHKIHPQSNKLFVLEVLTDHKVTIVTNATNATIGKQVVVAQIGAILPNGKIITKNKVLGIESEGMLCGTKSLGKEATEGVLLVKGTNGDQYLLE